MRAVRPISDILSSDDAYRRRPVYEKARGSIGGSCNDKIRHDVVWAKKRVRRAGGDTRHRTLVLAFLDLTFVFTEFSWQELGRDDQQAQLGQERLRMH